VSLKIKTIMAEVRSRFESFYGPGLIKIMLYGSHARGDAEPGSDIDILVVLRGPVDSGEEIARTGGIVADLSLRFGEVISCVFIDEEKFMHRNGPFLRNVRREGIAI
jgi:predicted nucleotidyltransferase